MTAEEPGSGGTPGDRRAVVVQHDVAPVESGAAVLATTLDAERGCPDLVQQYVAIGVDGDWNATVGEGGQCWYVDAGSVTIHDGALLGAAVGTGFFLPPGRQYRIANDGHVVARLVAVALPAPAAGDDALVSSFEACPVERTGDREFRVLLGSHNGVRTATQFVGDIPPGRAPEHAHPYDEVVRVLEGEGRVHAGGDVHPLRQGTCVYLPPHVPHCLENTSDAPMRVLGVFHPADSPAAKVPLSATPPPA